MALISRLSDVPILCSLTALAGPCTVRDTRVCTGAFLDFMGTAAAGSSNSIYWLALSLTPGLGPTRGRKLVDRFPKIEDVFQASLTELEALNLQAQSAQHIALGKSLELANEEFAKAVAAGIRIICRDDAAWPSRLAEGGEPCARVPIAPRRGLDVKRAQRTADGLGVTV